VPRPSDLTSHYDSRVGRQIYVHVGSPKTGTTFLQQVLWSQRDVARDQGLLLPGGSFNDHFLATLDVRGLAHRPEHPPRAVGMWGRLLRQAEGWDGPSLISHELFAGASAEQATDALAAVPRDVEVHVVLTARDLVRQIPAEWQEHLKHRSTQTFEEFLAQIRTDTSGGSWFWRVQDFASVVRRWSPGVPASRVHVVTVPGAASGPQLLWERFARLLGLDPESFDLSVPRANSSLRLEQAELLRRVNAVLGDRLPLPGPYPVEVKGLLAQRVLAGRAGTPLSMAGPDEAFAVSRSRAIADELAGLGVDVVGDLDELRPPLRAATEVPAAAHRVTTENLVDESVAALAALLVEHRRRRTERDTAVGVLRELKRRPLRFLLGRVAARLPHASALRDRYRSAERRSRRVRGSLRTAARSVIRR